MNNKPDIQEGIIVFSSKKSTNWKHQDTYLHKFKMLGYILAKSKSQVFICKITKPRGISMLFTREFLGF